MQEKLSRGKRKRNRLKEIRTDWDDKYPDAKHVSYILKENRYKESPEIKANKKHGLYGILNKKARLSSKWSFIPASMHTGPMMEVVNY